MLRKLSSQEIRKWTPLYAKYQNTYLLIFISSIAISFLFPLINPAYSRGILVVLITNGILYLPTIWWQVKTGYLESPLFIPVSFRDHKIKAVSRTVSPYLFWVVIFFEILMVFALLSLVIHSLY